MDTLISTGTVAATVTSQEPAGGAAHLRPADFMNRVVAWPGDEPGYVNLHWTAPVERGPGMRGRPFRNLQDFMDTAQYAAGKPGIYKEVYFCLSTQKEAGKIIKGHITAARHKNKALWLKSIWLEIDVGTDKLWKSKPEAVAALTQFVVDTELPPPSAIVDSGGGLHAYWIASKRMSLAEWTPFAEGLKAEAVRLKVCDDTGVIADAARVLRVPGTFNNKIKGVPRPVKLLHLGNDYDFETEPGIQAVKAKAPAATVTAAVTQAAQAQAAFELPATFANGPSKLLAGLVPEPFDGIDANRGDAPLKINQLLTNCPHFRHVAATKGAGQPEPVWALDMLACTWLDNGPKLAHAFSKGYAAYDPGETDRKYAEKVAARANGVGWPSCQSFKNNGCAQCLGCPFSGKIKSPLNLCDLADASEPGIESAMVRSENPIVAIKALYRAGARKAILFEELNKSFAVVRNGSEVLVACITSSCVTLMKPVDFHNMLANVRLDEGDHSADLSRLWWKWEGRRQHLGRGVVFDPGGPLEIPDDMLNLYRGFGVEPKLGDWSLLRDHILNAVCSGKPEHFDYLIRWMAYAVQHLDRPIGVAVALLGPQGAGKGVLARTFGKIFGRNFAHIAHGDQLTGRFNASVGTACAVFLDEAIWAADKKAEGVLKALITEPTLQMEAKFRDPIMVQNRLRIMVASNNDWSVPAGVGDRRWFVLRVASTFAGLGHRAYFDPLYAEIDNGGAEAMLHDLLHMDLTGFDVRAIPHTAAKAHQQVLSLHGTEAWVHQILQDGAIGSELWGGQDLVIGKDHAYGCYEAFSRQQRDYRPETKAVWSKKLHDVFGACLRDTRPGKVRTRSFQFAALAECRARFAAHIAALDLEWEAADSDHTETAPSIQPATGPAAPYDAAVNATAGTRNHDSGAEQQASALQGAAGWGARDLAVVHQAN